MSRQRRRLAAVRRAMPRRPRLASARGDGGMVILETAIAIPTLAAVAAGLAWAVSIGGTALQLGDTVRSAARELARGEGQQSVLDRARDQSPTAQFDVFVDGGRVVVSAQEEVAIPVPLLNGFHFTIHQQADVPMEWA